ncbi:MULTISPECIES: sensor histidine kinase [Streptosporangium]|uniref:histidine kinase n=1 Tax=Streptosporangium brasiliense TaxID=47480 RepID=A0ABT9RAN4_9ACTN|nr:sensor histidine kinase [Streptosporangium brasiliense]MDP9865912.1 signal transduction histidine kinase [Streptosporangium brasiliense]
MSQRPPPTAIDWLIAVVMALFAVAEEVGDRAFVADRPHPGWWIVVAAASVLVLLRRRAPATVTYVYSLAAVAAFAYSGESASAWQFCAQLLLLFTLLSEVPPRDPRAVAGLAVTALFVGAMMFAPPGPPGPGDAAVALVMTSITGGAGVAVRRHRQLAFHAQERGELLAREAVSKERTRIARELHDVVAHSVSVMVMQAGAARLMLRPDQVTEREALNVVEETGREAVEELRRMLGLLRTGREGDGLAPQPSLARLDDLVEQMRTAGLDVRLSVEGEPVPLPAGLDLSAYRIVQAALANTLRHAGPTGVEVTVAYRPRALSLEILDEGPRAGRTGSAGEPGHGLIGMRERVALFHGRLSAGPLPGGGYGVRVTLPLVARIRPGEVVA